MQGGREPRRGIYVARRVVAALVVLLLLILLVPWACQNLLGPGEQSSSETSETDDADSSDEGSEEAARDEEAAKDDGGIRPRIPVASGGIPSETRVARLAQRTTKKTPATRRMARAVEGQTSSRILSGSLAVSRLSVVWSRFRRL
jgi:hypothetical protein